jgi:hypothetical protein
MPLHRQFLILATLFAAQAAAAADSDEVRHPSAQERASFDAFYRARFNDVPLGTPAFSVERPSAGRPWTVTATIDSPPVRGVAPLCRATRSVYLYDPRAAASARWSPGPVRHFAWLDKAACRPSEKAVELLQQVPDVALIPLLDQHGVLLLRARLLFSGNTSCAPVRALRFRLAGIEVSAPPYAAEQLYGLVFDSDRDMLARVWVKQRGAEWNAWSVACAAAPVRETGR